MMSTLGFRLFTVLVTIILLGATPALAIGNGGTEYGSVTGTGTQDFSFYAESGDIIRVGLTEITQDAKFSGAFNIYRPNNTSPAGGNCGAQVPGCRSGWTADATGMWYVRAKNTLGSTWTTFTGNFAIHVVVSRQESNNTAMYAGQTAGGSITNASLELFTFNATAGDTFSVTMTPGAGFSQNAGFDCFYPNGASIIGGTGNPVTRNAVGISTTGTYQCRTYNAIVFSGTGAYTFALSGNTGMPTVSKQDGKCLGGTCGQAFAASSRPANSSGGVFGGNPFNISTGNKFETVVDYTTVGGNPLALIRYYNSLSNQRGTYATNLGPNWRHNYDRYIRAVSSTLTAVERPDGQVINFTKPSSTWVPDSDVPYTLSKSGSTWTLTDPEGVVETYTESAGKGTLDSIAYPNGYTQTMAYSSSKLSTVTDSYSRVLTFSYTSAKLTGVSTPDPATLTYGYTTVAGKDLLTSITYNTSPSTSQTYVYANANGQQPYHLTSITDENGNTYATWAYDPRGRVSSSQHAGGADLTTISYDDSNGQRTVTGPLGEVQTYSFTTSQNMRKVSQIVRSAASPVSAATRDFTYDGNGFLATAEDWNGNETRWTNNSKGQPTSITEAYGTGLARTTTISYDSNCPYKPEVITKTNLVVTNDWDNTTCDLLSTEYEDDTGGATDGQTHVWTWTYSDYGLVASVTEPRTDTTITTSYDYTDGVLVTVTDDLGHVTTTNTYTDGGYPTQITDPNGVVTDITYDNRMRWLTKTVNASTDEVTTVTRIGSGQLNLVTLPDSSTIDYNYDNAQRLTTATNTAGETINYTLNAMGKPTTVTFKDSGGTTRKSYTATYDVLGDMLSLVGAGGANETTTFAYDGMQNRTSVTDARSKTTTQAWDALLRPTTVTDHLTKTAAPTYNNLDYVTAQTDFLGYSTSYTRDGFGNAVARSSPDSGSWSFTFDENNNLKTITDARSVATTLTYDGRNRLTARSITGYSGEAESFTYDSTVGGNKGVGRLTSWSDESGSGSRIYDNFGNITNETRVINGKTYSVDYGYDLANRITQIIYPSGRYVNYTYDSSGYLTTVTTKPSAGGGVTTLASSITHKPFGPISGLTYGNSEAQTRTFSNNYWLTDLDTVNTGTYVQQLDYGYDYAGNLTSITDNQDNTRNETFTYDDLERLYTASGKYGSRTYTYDDNSGRATKVIGGGVTWTTTRVASKNRVNYLHDGTNQRDFTWTANGNMATDDRDGIGGGALAMTYGGRDRLESVTVGGNAVTFKVNAFGQRNSKAFSGTTTHYVHDIRGLILADANGSSGATVTEYVWMEGEMLAQVDSGGNIVYVHNSHIGAPMKITNPSRTVVWDRIQEPFGETYSTPTNTTPTVHRFPGQIYDSENALNYNNMRDYDPTGPFYLQIDPLGQLGGFNQYLYASQNPLMYIDPYGLYDWNEFVMDVSDAEINVLQGWAGFSDAVTFGATNWARDQLGTNYADPCSTAYKVGGWLGVSSGVVSGGAGLIRGGLRVEMGNWKQAGQWIAPKGQERLHFHFGVGPGLQDKHLPYQASDWLQNLKSLWARDLAGPDLTNIGLVGAGAGVATSSGAQNCECGR